MKTYGFLPIIKQDELPKLTDSPVRHHIRKEQALTELIARIALINNHEVRQALTDYHACLIEDDNGSRIIGVDFPEKRFF